MKKKIFALVLSLLLIALTIPTIVFAADTSDNGKVIVHFYSADNVYKYPTWNGQTNVRWGAYYWIDTASIVESGTYDNPELDPDFSNTDDSGVTNTGRIFRINLTESETAAVRAGKKLGLIMVRSFMSASGKIMPYWCGSEGKDLTADRFLSVELDSNNEYHVWIVAGDKNNYESLDEAKKVFDKVQAANFDDFNTLIVKTSKKITSNTIVKLYKDTNLKDASYGELIKDNLRVSVSADGKTGTVHDLNLAADFDWNADYKVVIEEVSEVATSCNKTRLYLSSEFAKTCVPSSDVELGAIYTPEKTTFRLWAPVSTNVEINFYKKGDSLNKTVARESVKMALTGKGVWEAVVEGDLNGVYYTYLNYVEGECNEVVDVYAKAVGLNGDRAMVCDMRATDPVGWDADLTKAVSLRNQNSKSAVIWEIHVRDFSIAADNGITYKGKYLAFTEDNTHAKGNDTIKTGISYLKDLGVNYVHLNPVYDFETVDEGYLDDPTYQSKQNWGYDPKNYNVPEGSYSTNPYDGAVRINEFKQMVQALHEAGIGVIMDVVYNHTYTSNSWFEQTVPGYYYRQALAGKAGTFGHKAWSTNALGLYNLSDGSGCGNETASERAMFRQYMINSLVYWATEYHIDGFRFDLMGVHDVETMNQIRKSLNALEGGSSILMYGEPWTGMSGVALEDGIPAVADNLNHLSKGIAAFNDRMRNGIKGGNGWDNSGPEKGYVQGNMSNIDRVKNGINGLFDNYNGGVISNDPGHTITYTTSHDNYTLWDHLLYTTVGSKSPTVYSEYNSVVEKKNMMAATLVLTSKGTSFILAGEEIARTKYGNHNSYNAQDKINALDYYRQEDFAKLYNWYKGLIELRTKRFTTFAAGTKQATVSSDTAGHLNYVFTREVSSDQYSKVQVLINPFGAAWSASISGSWTVIADGAAFNFNSTRTASGTISVPAYSAVILVQK